MPAASLPWPTIITSSEPQGRLNPEAVRIAVREVKELRDAQARAKRRRARQRAGKP
jgi:hypothetical protein